MMLKRLVLEQNRDHDVQPMVVSLTQLGPVGRELQEAGIAVRAMGLHGLMNAGAVLIKLHRHIRSARPDIVQTWMYHADLLGGVAARLAGQRNIIWGIRNTDLFHGAGVSDALSWIAGLCARLSSSVPRAIVCVAEAARRNHVALGYSPSKMLVIPNGFVDKSAAPQIRRALRAQMGIADDALVIGSVGRFNAYKDYPNFVSAMGVVAASVPAARFVMVGRGIDTANSELQALIAATGFAGRFLLLGEQHDVVGHYAAMDIFCLHSRSEGFPNVLGEAMLAGVASVTTDVGDAALMSDGRAVVVPPEDSSALAEAVTRIANMSGQERDAMGRAGRERILTTYSLPHIAQHYRALYDRLLSGRHSDPPE